MNPPESGGPKLLRDIVVTIACTVAAGLILSVIQTPFTVWTNHVLPQFGWFIAQVPLWLRSLVLALVAVCAFLWSFMRRQVTTTVARPTDEAFATALPSDSASPHESFDAKSVFDPYEPTYTDDRLRFAITFMITTTVAAFFLGIRPAKFRHNRIQLPDLQSSVKELQVANRGYVLPFDVTPPFSNLDDGIQKLFDSGGVREAFRLHSSGLLTYVRVNPEDVRDQNDFAAPRVMGLLYLIKTISAMSLCARNMARMLLADDEHLSLEIRLTGLLGRTLINDQPDMFSFQQSTSCLQDSIITAITLTRRELETKAGTLSTDFILKALWHFNHAEMSRDIVEDCQRGWVEGREPLAFPQIKAE
jgi:hypothetical protein